MKKCIKDGGWYEFAFIFNRDGTSKRKSFDTITMKDICSSLQPSICFGAIFFLRMFVKMTFEIFGIKTFRRNHGKNIVNFFPKKNNLKLFRIRILE